MALCARCGFEFYFIPKLAVNVIAENEKGEILIGRRTKDPHYGKLNTPGGHINPGETAEQAAAREVKEESGMDVSGLRYLSSYPEVYLYQGVEHKALVLAFVARVSGRPRAGSDMAGLKFLLPKDVDIKKLGFESDRKAMRDYLRSSKKPKNR